MFRLKPIFLWKYLKSTPNPILKDVKRMFYLSWEDALWDILKKKNVKKNSIVLVPEFFCGDVENNIRNHGYKVAYYPVSDSLKTTTKELTKAMVRNSPSVLVIFHMIGIENSLMKDQEWLKNLKKETILIEDCVHQIIDINKIKFLRKNHLFINSLRKVVPLQGSFIYGKKEDLLFEAPAFYQSFFYSLKVHFLWLLMNVFWLIKLPKLANYYMKVGYNLIGDSLKPAPGFIIFNWLERFINNEKIKEVKKNQIEIYEKRIKSNVPYTQKDKRELIAYPIVLSLNKAGKILTQIRKNGLYLNFELNDSQWSKKQKIICLPLGPHLKDEDINNICQIILQSINIV